MTIEATADDPATERRAGAKGWSVVSANVANGDVVTMDGEIVTAFADASSQDLIASVIAIDGEDATVQVLYVTDGSAANATDVEVVALVE